MKYAHILQYVTDTPWALLPAKLEAIVALLEARGNGLAATADELAAFAGGQPPGPSQSGSIAVLSVRGVIAHRAGMLEESSGGLSTETFAKTFRRAMTDPTVSAVVLDVDSPGGAVAGLHELATEMLALRGAKPVVAVANSMMASAGYWLAAAAADEIVAIPSATVGAIGVASIYVDDSKRREKEGVAIEVFTSAEHKAEVLGIGPLSPDARARMQARVDEAGQWFRSDVAKGRGISISDVRTRFGEGSAFGAKDALAAGLVDRIGTLDETLARLATNQGRARVAGRRAEHELPALAAGSEQGQPVVTDPLQAPDPAPVREDVQARRLRLA